jgi:hypothetical protein
VYLLETVEIISDVAPQIQRRRFFSIELGVAPFISSAQSYTLLVIAIAIVG